MSTYPKSQSDFYREFLMARQKINPRAYGVDMSTEEFLDIMYSEFSDEYTFSVDELLLRPRVAIHFCDAVRRKHNAYDLPDDIILRALLTRRKNPPELDTSSPEEIF